MLVSACLAEAPTPPPSSALSARPQPTSATTTSLPPAVSPTPTDPAPPTAVPLAAIPPDLPTRATVEGNGVRLTIELERNPMPAGQPTWVRTTIKNTEHDAVVYYPCGEAVPVGATIADLPWRPGKNLPNPAMSWKKDLTGGQGLEDGRRVLFFVAGEDGAASGCGDIGHVATIAPGATFRERVRWDGLTFRRLNPPPTASIDLVGSFSFDRGDPDVEHPPEDRHLLEAHLDTWIAGQPGVLIDPAEAVDIALTEPRLTALLATHDLRNGNGGVLLFDPKTGVYQIGLIEENVPVAQAHLVLVNARTGGIVGFVERNWDFQVDGFP